jgi:hypothetical protein
MTQEDAFGTSIAEERRIDDGKSSDLGAWDWTDVQVGEDDFGEFVKIVDDDGGDRYIVRLTPEQFGDMVEMYEDGMEQL